MIDQKRKEDTETAILHGYAARMEDPGKLRSMTEKTKPMSDDAAWDALF